jgi:hypothetical protein
LIRPIIEIDSNGEIFRTETGFRVSESAENDLAVEQFLSTQRVCNKSNTGMEMMKVKSGHDMMEVETRKRKKLSGDERLRRK